MIESKPTKTYRGTWDELMRRQGEFAPDTMLEMKVSTPDTKALPVISEKNAAAIALLQSWIEEDATDAPDERRQAAAEIAELCDNINKNRVESCLCGLQIKNRPCLF